MKEPIDIYMEGWRLGASGQKIDAEKGQAEIEQLRLRGYVDGVEAAHQAYQRERGQARLHRGGEVTVQQALATKRRLA